MNVIVKENTKVTSLNEVVNSNVAAEDKISSIERLKNGLPAGVKKADTYFECPPIRTLSAEERRELVVKTFKLGNSVFFNPENEVEGKKFVHSYSLRYIKLDETAIKAIESYEKRSVFI